MSLGRELKALREKNGLTIEELSEQTHIGTHILEDLEAGDFGRIRAAIYGSGFVKILAKHYGIDGTQLRETFATEYQAWVVANAKTPAPKKSPLKFTDRRFGAKPAEAAPALRPGGNAGDVKPAPTPAPATPNLMAAPSGPPPAAAAAQPDPLDNPVEEPLGGLFAGIEEAAPVQRHNEAAPVLRHGGNAGEVRPAEAAPVQRPAAPEPVLRPSGNAGEVKPAPAPRKQRPPRKPRKPLIDKAALLASARTSIRSLYVSVAGVIRTPLFQRIGVAALAIALSAWLCSLFIGGEAAPVLRPGGNAGDIGAEAPRPEVAAPAAPVQLPGGNAGAVGAEAPLSDSAVPNSKSEPPSAKSFTSDGGAVRRQPVHNITGSALTDNLLPPPDCYAD